ncbi:MAG: PAS domain-containing sensor histidine kinase [Candidatus Omnitrophota bacterium]
MAKQKTNIAIIGGGKGGLSLIELLNGLPQVYIKAVVDKNLKAPGIVLAKKLGLPTATNWKKISKDRTLNQIIDVTGNRKNYQKLLKEKPAQANLVSGPSAKLMWLIFEQLKGAYRITRDITEKAPFGIYIVNNKGNIEYANPAMAAISGDSPRWFKNLNVFAMASYQTIGLAKKIKEALRGKHFRMQEVEFVHQLSNKRSIRNFVGIPLLEYKTPKVLMIVEDITERKKAENAIKRAVEEWDRTFNAISDLVFIQDQNYTITRVNKSFADILKMPPAQIVGKKCYELLHRTNHPWPGCPLTQAKADNQPHTAEVDDPKIGMPLLVSVSPIFDSAGELIGSVHIAKDISEQKKAEVILKATKADLEIQTWGLDKTNQAIKLLYKELAEKNRRLEELDRLKSEFVSTVSHELRTPLSITKEGISLILDGIPGEINEKQIKILTTARNNIDRLARIINDLLDISRIESGKMKLKKELVNIKGLVQQVATAFQPKIQEKGLELKVALPKEKIDIYADSDRIIQVLTNLAYNSIKFTEKGYIKIAVSEKENELECSVSDTGIGISPDNLSRLFNKFLQFGRIAGAGEKGTGLGLSIAKQIVKMHNGDMWAESPFERKKDDFGPGAKLTFNLPKYTPKAFLKEAIHLVVQAAIEKDSKVSLITVSLANKPALRQHFSDAEIESILKIMEEVLKSTLRKEEDMALKVNERVVVLLSECDQENAERVGARLKKTLDDYLALQGLREKVALNFEHLTYPDDTKHEDELLNQAIKEKQ